MGLWWKVVKKIPSGGISIKGDPKAWPKWNPFWRFQHEWVLFNVESNGEPYFVYFNDGVTCMQHRELVKTHFFAARIGVRDIRFASVIDVSDQESLSMSVVSDEELRKYLRQFIKKYSSIPHITFI